MSQGVRYTRNLSDVAQIAQHLQDCDLAFQPPFSSRVELPAYAAKLGRYAIRFEAWSGDLLTGLAAAYCNGQGGKPGFISNVSVLPTWTGQGISSQLMAQCPEYAIATGLAGVDLEVSRNNNIARALYHKHGFHPGLSSGDSILMSWIRKTGANPKASADFIEISVPTHTIH